VRLVLGCRVQPSQIADPACVLRFPACVFALVVRRGRVFVICVLLQGGHALVAVLTEGATPVYRSNYCARGGALGMVTQLPDKDEVHMTFQQMLARLDVCMGRQGC